MGSPSPVDKQKRLKKDHRQQAIWGQTGLGAPGPGKSQVGSRHSKSICPTTSFLALSLDDSGVHMNTPLITLASQIFDAINSTPLCRAHICLCSCPRALSLPLAPALLKYQTLLSNPKSYPSSSITMLLSLCLFLIRWKCPVSRDYGVLLL